MKLFESRIGLKPLAALCRRWAISLSAGVDVRNVLAREAANARGLGRRRLADMSHDVAAGSTIADALVPTGNYFPDFFRALVRVGEETGHLPEVLRQLAEHYEHQMRLRRNFWVALSWPILELTMALSVVGFLIWLMGAIPALRKSNADILGFGLTGNSGLIKYLCFLAVVGAVLFVVYRATTRGLLWAAPVQRVIMSIPRLGRAIETLAMARLSWAMYVTLNSGMDLRRALRMSLASTHNVVYTQHIDRVLGEIRAGREIHEALAAANVFPIDFLDAVQVGEESGKLTESMAHLAQEYQDQARSAMNTLTILLGMAVTGLIAAVIIFLIFRVFSFYVGTINDALKMGR
ncbi:MAG: type II secretion system F family protein [Pirellulales bacterium]